MITGGAQRTFTGKKMLVHIFNFAYFYHLLLRFASRQTQTRMVPNATGMSVDFSCATCTCINIEPHVIYVPACMHQVILKLYCSVLLVSLAPKM